jgi:hypothetical protein
MCSKKYLQLTEVDGFTVLDIGDMEIWDGADLALLRETLTRLVNVERCKAFGVNMTFVKYIPSGFFGMMHDWHDAGVRVRLFSPQPNVARMLWFSRFFPQVSPGVHELTPSLEPVRLPGESATEAGWLAGAAGAVAPQLAEANRG